MDAVVLASVEDPVVVRFWITEVEALEVEA